MLRAKTRGQILLSASILQALTRGRKPQFRPAAKAFQKPDSSEFRDFLLDSPPADA